MGKTQSESSKFTQQSSVATSSVSRFITPSRLGYGLAGAFIFAGAAVAVPTFHTPASQSNATLTKASNEQQSANTSNKAADQPTTDTADTSTPSQTSTTVSASTGNAGAKVQVNVNGQAIAVPANGTNQQTVSNSDGSTTQVTVSGNTNSQGTATNQSSSYFSLDVQSNSVTSGGVSEDQ